MPKVSTYARTRIELLHKEGLHPAGIFRVLEHEDLIVSFPSVARIVKKLQVTGTLANFPRSGRPSKLSKACKSFYRSTNAQGRRNDEWPDTKEAGKAWHYRKFVHGTTISQGTRLDIAAALLGAIAPSSVES